MKAKTAALVFSVVCTLAAVTSCNKNDDKSSAPVGEDPPGEALPSTGMAPSAVNAIVLPRHYQFSSAAIIPAGENWQEMLALMPASDQAYLEKVNAEYFGIMAYNNIEELRQMAQLGIPLPQEWLKARNMTDEGLRSMADAGNTKAKMFYADRLVDKAVEYLHLRKNDPAAYDAGPGARAAISAYVAVGQLDSSISSPFAAYQSGRMQYLLDTSVSPEFVAGSMFAALDRGDVRADRLLGEFSKEHPAMDPALIMSIYQSLKPEHRACMR